MRAPKRSLEEIETRRALQRIVQHPDWQTFVDWLATRVHDVQIDPSNPNAGALFRIEGRRSLHRAIEDIPRRVRDDGNGDSSG